MDIDAIKEIISYNPDSGVFRWKYREEKFFKRPQDAKSWNKKYAFKEAFTSTTRFGHKQGFILGEHCLAHRIAYAIMEGKLPSADIDHINGDPGDNRYKNLRSCTRSKNLKNKKKYSNNKSGVCGVNWRESHKKWRAAFRTNGKEIHIGYFDDLDEAKDAVFSARSKSGFTDRHGC